MTAWKDNKEVRVGDVFIDNGAVMIVTAVEEPSGYVYAINRQGTGVIQYFAKGFADSVERVPNAYVVMHHNNYMNLVREYENTVESLTDHQRRVVATKVMTSDKYLYVGEGKFKICGTSNDDNGRCLFLVDFFGEMIPFTFYDIAQDRMNESLLYFIMALCDEVRVDDRYANL